MKNAVCRAYIITENKAYKTLLDSHGKVYAKAVRAWVEPTVGKVIAVPGHYERWVDVPRAWLGHQPYWR